MPSVELEGRTKEGESRREMPCQAEAQRGSGQSSAAKSWILSVVGHHCMFFAGEPSVGLRAWALRYDRDLGIILPVDLREL